MTTAQRILASHTDRATIEFEAREIAIETRNRNCFDRTWIFFDGSCIVKNREGYTASTADLM